MTNRTMWLGVVSTSLSCGAPEEAGCDVADTARELAGPDATDCGSFEVGADPTDGWACAVEAFEAGEPFFVVYEDAGTDSLLVGAFVSDGLDQWRLQQDQYGDAPWGVDGWDCVGAEVGTQPDDEYDDADVSGYPVVTCESIEPEGNHYQVCGEICSPDACQPQPLPFER